MKNYIKPVLFVKDSYNLYDAICNDSSIPSELTIDYDDDWDS